MKNLRKPQWLFIINTLPLVVLFFLCFSQYNIIKSLLEEDNIQLWKSFGLALGSLGILNFAYALYASIRKMSVSVWFACFAMLFYITFMYVYGYNINEIIPFSVPSWMIQGNIFLYVGTFLMPTLAYALFIIVHHFTPTHKEHKAWVNFLIAIAIPLIAYLFSQIILPLWRWGGEQVLIHVSLVGLIAITIVFLFFLIRGVYILITKKANAWRKYQLLWKIPIAFIFPILGLLLNNGWDFIGSDGIFGNFSSYWYYILTIVNGILICLPNLDNKPYRFLVFLGRSILFAFTLYFFMVFLPFLPLAVVAIIAMGGGFLLLAPLLIFAIHIQELTKDFTYLNTYYTKKVTRGSFLVGFILIPTIITLSYLHDKSVLNETLAYIYSPDYAKEYTIDTNSLQNTLDVIKDHKDSGGSVFGARTPYLSSYYNWLVLDNLTLSDAKIHKIESIFFKEVSFQLRTQRGIPNKNVQISNIETTSTYDSIQKAWKSWINLEITNQNENGWNAEYATTFDLPEGCWISDYYLYVGDKKEPGILAEKKSAMWIFSQITNENRDPGILYYLQGNKIAFRVFPFASQEVRKTGIELLHKEPVQLTIDDHVTELGNANKTIYENVETSNIIYLSAQEKQGLNMVKRTPYFHFLIDASNNSATVIPRVKQLTHQYPELAANAKVSFVNSYVTTTKLNADWDEAYKNSPREGGFYLDRAIKKTLFNTYKEQSATYPVMVVVTDSLQNAIVENNFSDFKFAYPESDLFYVLDEAANLKAHSLSSNPLIELPEIESECMFCETVLAYTLPDNSVAYVPNDNAPSIILKEDVFTTSDAEVTAKNWETALTMQGQWRSQIIHPERSDEEWLSLVKNSFISKVMTPVTSYLVVENEAQKAMLKKKQEQVLAGNKDLDLGEDTQRMSEPSLNLLMALLGLIIMYLEKRKRNFKH